MIFDVFLMFWTFLIKKGSFTKGRSQKAGPRTLDPWGLVYLNRPPWDPLGPAAWPLGALGAKGPRDPSQGATRALIKTCFALGEARVTAGPFWSSLLESADLPFGTCLL